MNFLKMTIETVNNSPLIIENQKEINDILIRLDKKQGIYFEQVKQGLKAKTYIPYESIIRVSINFSSGEETPDH